MKQLDFLTKAVIIQCKVKKKIYCSLQKNYQKKIRDPRNAKEHYQSFIRKKNTKSLKKIRNNYLATKNF